MAAGRGSTGTVETAISRCSHCATESAYIPILVGGGFDFDFDCDCGCDLDFETGHGWEYSLHKLGAYLQNNFSKKISDVSWLLLPGGRGATP